MKKRLLLILLVPAIWVLLIFPVLSQEDMEVVEDDGFQKRQRPPAVFKHDDHNETAEIEECNECHHIYEDGEKLEDESSEDQPCSDCHSENSPDNRPGLKKAFHLNCKGCHQTKKKGPIMCGQCHIR
ncbi:MAG: cytochrome c family protein [Deltaproteobacteria bacterium]|nr:cytochrome c family protein [Deltaproteobacteria bacterium]